jgi:methionyl-tRNA synthetase
MPWGVAVPDDKDHVMYVWFDALVDYISAIGWPDKQDTFKKWWIESGGVVQYCGKDNLRQQAAMWQAMLMAADLAPSQTIVVDGFITGEGGVKMSKSLGNTVNPLDLVKEYGTDAVRYFMLRELSPFEDSPFTADKFKEAYNANLANGIGNLTSRILKLTSTYSIKAEFTSSAEIWSHPTNKSFQEYIAKYDIQRACNEIWEHVSKADGVIQESAPFKLLKSEDNSEVERGVGIMVSILKELWQIAVLLEPILPETALKMQKYIQENRMPEAPLFLRK